MSKYAFVLGRNPDISIAELGALFGEKLEIAKNSAVAFFESTFPAAPQDFLNRLGGCVEILEIFEWKIPVKTLESALGAFLSKRGLEFPQKMGPKPSEKKILFAINLVPENKRSQLLKFLLPRVKKLLRTGGQSAAFLNKNFLNVNAVAAMKQKLVESGTNVSVIDEGEGKISLGYSVAMQDFEAYSKRDYGKPFRDPQAGMLPPKLAQILINIAYQAEPVEAKRILDPFCGTGTIIMEAMLMGYSVVGSDSEVRMIEGAKKNVEWLKQNFRLPGQTSNVQIFHKNATEFTTQNLPKKPFAIVTEPYLGPALSQFPAEKFLNGLMNKLETLYFDFFKNLARQIISGTPIVFIFPYWRKSGQPPTRLSERLVAKIETLGYSKTAFVPLQKTSLFYDRPDSVVGREIVRFVKN